MRNIFLHVTRACNLRCPYCYLDAGRAAARELSTADLAPIWPQIVALGPRKVVFTGGEPLLRPDLCALLQGMKAADPEHLVLRCLNTNGMLMTRDRALALAPLVDEVRVSIDALSVSNDRLRGEGSFEAALRALETLYSAGLEPVAMVTVTRAGVADLEELLGFLFARRITRVHLNPFRAIGRGGAHADWAVTLEEVRAALDRAWRRMPGGSRPVPAPGVSSNCGAGCYLNILPDGDVYPCHALTAPEFRLGNVTRHSLLQICGAGGMLARLQALDFNNLAQTGAGWKSLLEPGSCLGIVLEQARARGTRAWSDLERAASDARLAFTNSRKEGTDSR